MKQAILLAEADAEMMDAARFYQRQAAGLGERFLEAVYDAIAEVRRHPKRWPKLRGNVRRRLVGRFPYGILYIEDPTEIVVVAVMHLHRHPDYWTQRLPNNRRDNG